ncbi:MAG: hypothetical protein QOE45_2721 [Frankiaceae bacterium]|jgi:hypothetical protein|nr:hypothetical protein [Frankiaceae bacterium]
MSAILAALAVVPVLGGCTDDQEPVTSPDPLIGRAASVLSNVRPVLIV